MDESRRCTAHKKNGVRCGKSAILGGNVCGAHGGRAPQVKQAARERLAALVDPAIATVGHLVRKAKHEPTRLAAAKDVLDRNGYAAKFAIDLSGEVAVKRIAGVVIEQDL